MFIRKRRTTFAEINVTKSFPDMVDEWRGYESDVKGMTKVQWCHDFATRVKDIGIT